MKIEKKKITGIKSISLAAKSTLAATLGMLGALTLNACDDSTSASSDPAPTPASEDSQPTSSSATTGDSTTPESSSPAETLQSSSEQTPAQQSSSEQAETSQSSSSQVVVDIPLSHEHISSSVMEALSAAAESSSSATKTDSSAATESSSSSFDHYQGECPDGPLSPTCNLKYCETPDGPCTPVVSMVTTFERTDIEV